ncbi:FimV/HubP family polar landmark protein [Pseudomonas sp. TUM22785]|uniref:FimV/HubP family polar landmark protein n=1 Tax=Pseudomonas sp. TUM22785 TaxID=3019098 RepID=UPI0023053503|nr:FimV/HubP family polar landmark protein [Pseudomonas sp. TUM22785]WCD82099.1 LysM peptidoglycan-binding domain-containing protein [Pseudomonas sp. TUM22785]
MARVNRILLALASGPILYSSLASAIGLGEITLHSALNQPLEADIGLLDVGDLTDSDIKISLAPADVFERAGVDRVLFLNDLRFSPMIRGASGHIRVVSNKPVREPYLNFIVEVARPNGRLLREYTLLLDPPEASAYNPVAAPLGNTAAQRDNRRSSAASSQPAPTEAPPATQGKRYTVVKGDNLWAIAQRQSAGSGMSTAQMMSGIHALNPSAFANGDPSRLSVGQSLLLPDAAMSMGAAANAAANDAGTTGQAMVGSAPGPVSAPGTPSQPAPLPQQIAEVQRRVDTELVNSENERLQLRQDIADLQLKLETLQRQMEQKDAQLARLQSALGPNSVQQASADAGLPPLTATAPADTPVADATNLPPLDDGAPVAPQAAQEPAPSESPAPVDSAVPQAPAEPAAEATQQGTPAVAAPDVAVQEPDSLDTWSRALMIIGGILLLFVLAVALLRRRQETRPEAPEPVVKPKVRPAEAVAVPAERPRIAAVPQVRPEPVVAVGAAAAPVAAPAPRPQPTLATVRPSSDSLDGANIYIAYGRFNDAESALRSAIVQEPNRTDLRFRLLEVLGELRDPSGFAIEESNLLEMGVGSARIDPIKARYPGIDQGRKAEPMFEEPEFVLGDQAPDLQPAEPLMVRDDELTDEFQLNLDDLPLDADWDSLSPFKTEAPKTKATGSKPEPVHHHVDPAFRSNLQDMPEVFELDDLEQADRLELPELPQAEELDELSFDFEDPLEASDDLDHLAARQENLMKLNLALAYIDQGDIESACSILNEVIDGGDEEQKQEARQLLAKIA